jgi:hypothetical protein
MSSQSLVSVIMGLFIAGMIWLRTRMQYVRRGSGAVQLQPCGRIYFASALACLAVGTVAAPLLGRALWPMPTLTPTLLRVIWFLGTYFVFIIVHRALRAGGRALYRAAHPSQ